jgi:hypothetical protein
MGQASTGARRFLPRAESWAASFRGEIPGASDIYPAQVWSMSDGRHDKRYGEAWELAGRQHGIVARRQLLALGFNPREIEHRLARGRLHPVMHGVYAVGWPGMTRKRRWMAAVLACGGKAMLSHRSAAALWQIGKERAGVVDVSVRRRCEIRRPGLRVRGRPSLAEADVTAILGIPVTAVARTLVDLATELGPLSLERAEDSRGLGRCGAFSTSRRSDSRTPISRFSSARSSAQPACHPDLDLVVETDGLRYHRTPSTQARDARRDRTHILAGMTPLRFTHYEIKYESMDVRRTLARAAAMQRSASDIDHT